MNQKHQSGNLWKNRPRSYNWIIKALLTCPSNKIEILQANKELVDAGLVKTMIDVAEKREHFGDHSSAKWLRNFATQITTGIGSSLSEIITEAEADELYWQGIELHRTSQFKASLDFLQPALEIYRKIRNLEKEGYCLSSLGNVYDFFGEYQKAIQYHQQSLEIAGKIGNSAVEGMCLGNLGKSYLSLGEYKKAIDCHQKSFQIAQSIGNRHGETISLGAIGATLYCQGKYAEALNYHQRQLALAKEIGDNLEAVHALGNLGLFFHSINQEQQAKDYFEKAMKISQKIGARSEEAATLSNLGIACRNDQAIEYFQQSLKIQREIGNRTGEASSLSGLGIVYRYLAKYQQAIVYFQEAIVIAQEIGDRFGEAKYLGNLGMTSTLMLNYQQAIEYEQQALTIAQEIDDRGTEGFALHQLGFALLNYGYSTKAETALRLAMETRESLRGGLEDSHKISICDLQSDTYSLLQQALAIQQKHQEALEIAERSRTRAFVELLYKRLSDNSVEVADEKILPPTIEQIRQIAQEQQATIVEYSIINLDYLFIWVIKPIGEIEFRSVYLKPLREQQNISLPDLIVQARESLGIEEKLRYASSTASPNTSQPIRHISQPLRQLDQYLIEPITNLLPTNPDTSVIFIPHALLLLVPFPALQDKTGKFLIEKHTIVTSPSIQVLALTRQKKEKLGSNKWKVEENFREALVVGNPIMPTIPLTEKILESLPGSEAEAKAIASLLKTQAIIGSQATKVSIVEKMPKARLIHLATHGLLDDIKQLGIPGAIAPR
ncbi:MAG: CHAT domain-containing protein [Symploca sp. SIO2E9]|nr:CHAT domain-containing protein [Symploca sp. SIO2E9]